MKLAKEYFEESKNAKHLPPGVLRQRISQICKKYFKEGISPGKIFMIDNDLDARWYAKVDKVIADWEKQETNVWSSSFGKMIRFYNVADKTTYLLYRKS